MKVNLNLTIFRSLKVFLNHLSSLLLQRMISKNYEDWHKVAYIQKKSYLELVKKLKDIFFVHEKG